MKIPLAYPKITGPKDCPLKKCIAFEKYDGTNIHWVWKNSQFCEFGTRRHRYPIDNLGEDSFVKNHPELKDCLSVFLGNGKQDKFDEYLHNRFYSDENFENKEVILFTEFFGENSFAGTHQTKDEKYCILIDVMINGIIIPPDEFIRDFKQFDIAQVIYQGKFNGQFIEDVRNGKFPVNEGVVCKGVINNQLYMTKIKTNDYLSKIQKFYPDQWEDLWE
jgi:hypothetical protein